MTNIEAATLKILDTNGKPVGTGFLVSKTLAITCAHVAATVGSVDGDSIQVQFFDRNEKLTAQIEPKYWRAKDKGDIAFLRLTPPEDILPLRLGLAQHSHAGNIFRSYGYASAAGITGIQANGSIDGYLPGKLLQLQSPQADHGISGAPVWDEARDVVIGMITKGESGQRRNAETTFATPSEQLFKVCPEIEPNETCPYLGLESFSAATERFFFGRTALIEKLLTTLRGGCRFLAVFGPSGSGKSSVVRAGLLPVLKNGELPDSQNWRQITIRPAENPFTQLKAEGFDLNDIQQNPNGERIILFVDQFEELFACSPQDREDFVNALKTTLENPRLMLIITMRDDFYSDFNAKAAALAASTHKTVVDVPATLTRNELIEIIERPAEAVGLRLEAGLTTDMIEDASTNSIIPSTTLPLLEFALTQLWDKRREGTLTHETYEKIGRVTGSLASWADNAYSALTDPQRKLAENLLTTLVHLGDEAQDLHDTRSRGVLSDFDQPTRQVINHFASKRLLITSGDSVELTHDALVRNWSRLQGWIKSDRDNLRLKEGISEAAREWEMAGRSESLLVHRGDRLDLAEAISKNGRYGLSLSEQAYLNRCVAIMEREAEFKKEHERQEKVLLQTERDKAQFELISTRRIAQRNLVIVLASFLSIIVMMLAYQPIRERWLMFQAQQLGNPILIKAGVVKLGDDNPSLPPHAAIKFSDYSIQEYKIDQYEVTNKRYKFCVDAFRCTPPNDLTFAYTNPSNENRPVVNITWLQASQFCAWIDRSLPNDLEWERAARYTNSRLWPWGNEPPTKQNQRAVLDFTPQGCPNSLTPCTTKDVGTFDNGQSEEGVFDLIGNVSEWTCTLYTNNDHPDTCFNVGDKSILDPVISTRGFGADTFADDLTSSTRRTRSIPTISSDFIGFRCVDK